MLLPPLHTGRGEGFAVVALRQQQEAGASALALLRGSAINTAGRSSGLTAPSGPAQHKLLVTAVGAAAGRGGNGVEWTAADVAFLAVHGTGTPLGDPIGTSLLLLLVQQLACLQLLPVLLG